MNFLEFAEDIDSYPASKWLDDIQDAIENNDDIVKLQTKQWDDGLDVDGDLLGRYSYWTAVNDSRKRYNEPYDIFDTGETRKNTQIFGSQSNKDLSLFYDSKSQALSGLMETIGQRLFGLQKQNIDNVTEISQDMAVELLNKNFKFK